MTKCNICGAEVSNPHNLNHIKSKFHQKAIDKVKNAEIEMDIHNEQVDSDGIKRKPIMCHNFVDNIDEDTISACHVVNACFTCPNWSRKTIEEIMEEHGVSENEELGKARIKEGNSVDEQEEQTPYKSLLKFISNAQLARELKLLNTPQTHQRIAENIAFEIVYQVDMFSDEEIIEIRREYNKFCKGH